jgi:hypothetical protein
VGFILEIGVSITINLIASYQDWMRAKNWF